jgi:2,3-bisphosphoglycerate-dependent phosphoglycerate mutase
VTADAPPHGLDCATLLAELSDVCEDTHAMNNPLTTADGRVAGVDATARQTTFYLCRHGQTEFNRAHRLQGHIDTPLTPAGVDGALRVARRLRGLTFARVYSSDLGRAFRTAYLISRELGLDGQIEATPALRERSFGVYHGQPSAEVRAAHPAVFGDSSYAPPEGESHRAVQERVLAFLNAVAAELPGENVLVVTHEGVLNAIRAAFEGIDVAAYHGTYRNGHEMVLCARIVDHRLIDVGVLFPPSPVGKGGQGG